MTITNSQDKFINRMISIRGISESYSWTPNVKKKIKAVRDKRNMLY